MNYYLGIDTSCYTTSCAIVDEFGEVVEEQRKLLEVKEGACGLQQSNMVFQHTRALPTLIRNLPSNLSLAGIGVSAFPRREENSYMPAFLVGLGQAETLAHLLQIPLYKFSHQENHILAALREIKTIPTEPFFSLHVSGGTTELLRCQYNEDGFFTAKLVGSTIDLHGGQFVDRIGVAVSLPFPAGPALEKLALPVIDYTALPIAVKDGQISFGGPCSEAKRRLEKGVTKEELARSVFDCLSKSLVKMLAFHQEEEPVQTIVAVGGVMSNTYLRQALTDFAQDKALTIHFAEPRYSCDNATGVAYGASILNKR